VTAEFEAALEKRKTDYYVLRLYIAGNNPRSQAAVENVKMICEEYLKERYEL
jgi:circadian clock protein KaiB